MITDDDQSTSDVTWYDDFDDRQKMQISFSRTYADDFHHGADGHNNMMIIAKLADKLDEYEALFKKDNP